VSVSAGVQPGEGEPAPVRLQLALFISGASPASSRAVRRLRDLCDRHFPDGYDLEIIDIYQQPEVVVSRGVLAVPTLFKELPLPVRVLIGDFTDESRVLAALGLSSVRGD
jgi:circadian clock protein KaiB